MCIESKLQIVTNCGQTCLYTLLTNSTFFKINLKFLIFTPSSDVLNNLTNSKSVFTLSLLKFLIIRLCKIKKPFIYVGCRFLVFA